MGTNCAPLLADLFLYSYETEFLDGLISKGNRKLERKFNFTYRYIDDLISFRNKNFQQHLSTIYPKELQIKPTSQSDFVTHYLDLTFMRDKSNNVSTKLYDKRDDFSFHIVNFPFLSSNISEIIELFDEKGKKLEMSTNGILLNKRKPNLNQKYIGKLHLKILLTKKRQLK